jgi:hypothetical protein
MVGLKEDLDELFCQEKTVGKPQPLVDYDILVDL